MKKPILTNLSFNVTSCSVFLFSTVIHSTKVVSACANSSFKMSEVATQLGNLLNFAHKIPPMFIVTTCSLIKNSKLKVHVVVEPAEEDVI